MRFELTTSSLPRKRSTPELRRRKLKKKSQAVVGCDSLFLWVIFTVCPYLQDQEQNLGD